MRRLRLNVAGRVQGVGFRPYVVRLAQELGLSGGVANTPDGLWIEVEGRSENLGIFLHHIDHAPPPAARIDQTNATPLPVTGERTFVIWPSRGEDCGTTGITTAVPLDLAPCADCRAELLDPGHRRHLYPFISCDRCGPRFSLAERLPFDRERTVMRLFPMCPACAAEYASPCDRRFYAQTISCPDCGPILRWHTSETGASDAGTWGDQALEAFCEALRAGGVVGLKGVGGYQLVALATCPEAIQRMRVLKQRRDKPLALMAPHLESVEAVVPLSAWEKATLTSPAAPIVLLRNSRRFPGKTASNDQPSNPPSAHTSDTPQTFPLIIGTSPFLGVMLPSSPLHLLIAHRMRTWLVVTSANGPGEPTEIDDGAMLVQWDSRLDGILTHNRPIVHRADDSVVREGGDGVIVLRHARGLAPTHIPGSWPASARPVVALGGHEKGAVGFSVPQGVILGPHVGDLNADATRAAMVSSVRSLQRLFSLDRDRTPLPPSPTVWVADGHPQGGSGAVATSLASTYEEVWHHDAHLESLIAETAFAGRALGVVWDGLGYRPDVPIAGGEFYKIDGRDRYHLGSIRPFSLIGGDRVAREPRRVALGLLYEVFGAGAFDHPYVGEHFTRLETSVLKAAYQGNLHTVRSTSMGRLFEGMAALLGVSQRTTYEGEAACLLEDRVGDGDASTPYTGLWQRDAAGLWVWDWEPLVIAAGQREGDVSAMASAFHQALATAIAELAEHWALSTVLLTGGVMQNARLLSRCHTTLGSRGMRIVTHQIVPPGDGGLALGQVALASRDPRPEYRSGGESSCVWQCQG